MALICNRTRNQVSMQGWNIQLIIGQSQSVTIYNVIHTGQKPGFFLECIAWEMWRKKSFGPKPN